MTLERQAIAGLKWGAIAKFATQIFSWIVTLVVIHILEPADYGVMALSAVITSVVAGIGELGLGASLVQAANPTREETSRVAGVLLVINGACVLLLCLLAPLVAAFFASPGLALVIQVSSAQFLMIAINAIPQALAYRELRFKWLAMIDILSGVTTSAATLILALAGAGVWALVFGGLLGYATRTLCLLSGGTFVRPTFRLSGITKLLRFGGAWSGARLAWQLTHQADIVIAGRLLSQEAVGVYAVAVQLANLPLEKAMGIVNQVAFSTLSKLQNDPQRMRSRLVDAIRLIGIFAIPALWGIGCVARELVDVALGSEWHGVVFPLQIMALVAPLKILSTLFATALSSLGRADVELINTLVSLGVLTVTLLFGVRWGLDGLAVGYAAGVVVSVLANLPRTVPIIGVSMRDVSAKCGASIVAGGIMLAAVLLVRMLAAEMESATRLILLIGAGAATYITILHVIDRSIWSDARKLVSALRAPA